MRQIPLIEILWFQAVTITNVLLIMGYSRLVERKIGREVVLSVDLDTHATTRIIIASGFAVGTFILARSIKRKSTYLESHRWAYCGLWILADCAIVISFLVAVWKIQMS